MKAISKVTIHCDTIPKAKKKRWEKILKDNFNKQINKEWEKLGPGADVHFLCHPDAFKPLSAGKPPATLARQRRGK